MYKRSELAPRLSDRHYNLSFIEKLIMLFVQTGRQEGLQPFHFQCAGLVLIALYPIFKAQSVQIYNAQCEYYKGF